MDEGIIFMTRSPFCDIEAIVERYRNSCYFYLMFRPNSYRPTLERCWLYNRKPDNETPPPKMRDPYDIPMPNNFVRHPLMGIELDCERFSTVWFAEGDGAALLYDKMLLAVIMPNNQTGKYQAFSRYAIGKAPYAWEIQGIKDIMTKKVNICRSLWKKYGTEGNPREYMLVQAKEAYAFVGNHIRDYNIAHSTDYRLDNWESYPPKTLVTGKHNGAVYAVTAGMSLPAMPKSSKYFREKLKNEQRTEIGFAVSEKLEKIMPDITAEISDIAIMPWRNYEPFVQCSIVQLNRIKGFPVAMLVNPKYYSDLESPEYKDFPAGGHVNMLWIVPLTQKEYDYIKSHSAMRLLKKITDISRIHIFTGEPKFIPII